MATTLTEYGQPLDPADLLTPADATELELDPGHPGEHDPGYVARRRDLFKLCQAHRLGGMPPPWIAYTEEEERVWQEVAPRLDALHARYACQLYLKGKKALGIRLDRIPQMAEVSQDLQGVTGMHLVPAEGALPYRTFYRLIANRGFPVTQFVRHGSHPEFTPEPDMIHDGLGHVPPLMDADYAGLLTRIGQAVTASENAEHVLAFKRFSWFSIEFGLIEEANEVKVFGAGILSSVEEIPNSLTSPGVVRRPFVTEEVIVTDYDPSRMQDRLFIAPSLPFLRQELERLIDQFGIPVG